MAVTLLVGQNFLSGKVEGCKFRQDINNRELCVSNTVQLFSLACFILFDVLYSFIHEQMNEKRPF